MQQATRILAIRHGETAWNVEGRIQGQLDIGLNATGHWQAARTAERLADEPVDALYASDLQRAWDTAQALAREQPAPPPLIAEPGLRERAFGAFEGRTFDEIAAADPAGAQLWRTRAPGYAPPAGGESLLDFRARVLATLARIAAPHAGEHIAVVSHGGVLDVLYRAATGQDLQAPRSWKVGNAAINRLLWTPDGLTLVGWSDDAHLARSELDDTAV